MNIHIHRRLIIWPLALLAVGVIVAGLWMMSRQPKTDIRTESQQTDFSAGQVVEGRNDGGAKELRTEQALTYESPATNTHSPTTNVVNLKWKQTGAPAGAELEVRVHDGKEWSQWVHADSDDKKDGVPAENHFATVLTSNAKQVQYRFALNGHGQAVAIQNPEITFIDATRGPDPTKQNLAQKVLGAVTKARADGPRIYSRAEWGSPQPNSSPSWTPNYWNPLRRVMVHHTVTAGNPGNSAAEVRGIWYSHAQSNGWGDIGYNYLVDKNGNIFQGRYYDPAQAAIYGEVEGGHTYGFNDYSIGIAALGDFTSQGGTTPMVYGIGNIAGWKMFKYGLLPWSQYTDEAGRGQYAINGHRDYTSTACPGGNMYPNLPAIRSLATAYMDTYGKWDQYDYSYQGQGVNGSPGTAASLRPGQSVTAYLDLKNEGTATWSNANVRLGTSKMRDRESGFRYSGWISSSRPSTFSGKVSGGIVTPSSTIAPGETARFEFTFGNQGVGNGTYVEYFQPLVENYTWFARDIGISWQLTSLGDVYSYQWLGQSYNVPTEPGQTQTITLDAKNTGNVDWKNDGPNPVRLGSYRPRDRASNLYHSSWISPSRPGSFIGRVDGGSVTATNTIAPGETARFSFTAQAPTYPFSGLEYFNLLAEGKTWMNDVGIQWPVNIPSSGYAAQFAGQSSPPTIDLSDGGIGSVYFDYQNTGSYAWRKSDGIVRLAPNRPNDHNNIFFATGLSGGQLPANTANWLSPSRVGTFVGQVNSGTLDSADAVIEPGQIGRFYAALDTRGQAPGTIKIYVNILAETFTWMPDIGVHLPVTIVP